MIVKPSVVAHDRTIIVESCVAYDIIIMVVKSCLACDIIMIVKSYVSYVALI